MSESEQGHGEGRSTVMSAEEWDERYLAKRMWSAEPNRFFAEAVSGFSPGRAIDLACGEGRNALWLGQNGWSVTAIDFSAAAIERGRTEAANSDIDVTWVVGDLHDHDLGHGVWDLVAHVYLHWPAEQRNEFMDRCVDSVAPGGRLVIVGHDRSNIEHGHGGPQDPGVLTTASELDEQLASAGLTVLRAEIVYRSVAVEQPDGTQQNVDAIDHVVVAERSQIED